jgi:hypothetical protein
VGATYTFTLTPSQPGTYDVFLWWTQWPTRMTNVPVSITHRAGIADVAVNQQANGGQWNRLGTWTFDAQAIVKIRSLGPGSTCADAVRLVPSAAPPPDPSIVLDNTGPGASAAPAAAWGVSSAPNPFGPNSLYSKSTGATFTFQLPLSQAGPYDVYLWWTQWPSRLTNVPVDIVNSAGTASIFVNQQVNGGQWNLVGGWDFGTTATITIKSVGGGTVCADAVKLVPR